MAPGPIVGGTLVSSLGWRSMFWINIPIAIAAIVLTLRFVPEAAVERARRGRPRSTAPDPRCRRRAEVGAPLGLLGGRVPVATDLAHRAALNALLERVAEAQGAPVLAAELVADLLAVQLALLPEEVLDQRDLAVEPPLVLFLVDARRRRERGVAGRAHRSPPR